MPGRLKHIRDNLTHFKKSGLPFMLQNEQFLHGQCLRSQRNGAAVSVRSGAGLFRGLDGRTHIGADDLFIVCQLKTSFIVK